MNGTRNGRTHNLDKPFPGCLGSMVNNLFDLSTSISGNKLLTDKPHHDGFPLSMRCAAAARMSPIVDPIEDKVIVSELRRSSSNMMSNGTPMKMLIAREMSKEVESKHSTPSLVARLMGLDALPQQQPDSAVQRCHSRGYSQSHLGIPLDYSPLEDGLDMQMQHEIQHYRPQYENRDFYKIWKQSQKGCYTRESPQKGRAHENINEKKMALVRQKFIEAKRLATNEKLRQSKQFQDALEVLSSNKDLFLQFLQEPNSLFSQNLFDSQPVAPPPETKRITVLRPSKMVDNNNKFLGPGMKDEKQIKKATQVGQVIGWDKSNPGFPSSSWRVNDNPTQPTQIIVLKPSLAKPHDIKAVISPPTSSPRVLNGQEFFGDRDIDEARDSREEAMGGITGQIHENLSGHRRDETLLSSVFSNGYIGDESSFNKSENEYAAGNISDTEVVSPTSRNSWDYINRFGSPYSSSSFSRVSYSPESSVCREAKKRLSERWAMIASNGNFQEQRHIRRSSSTLGEMLALSDTKVSVRSEEEDRNKEQEERESKLCPGIDSNKDENADNSPRSLSRSKSLPVSSTAFGGRLNVEVLDPEVGKKDAPKEATKQRSVKSSLKGKVSSLFFSMSRKSSKEKSVASQSKDEYKKSTGISMDSPEKISDNAPHRVSDSGIEDNKLLCTLPGPSSKTSAPDLIGVGPKQAVISAEAGLSVIKPVESGNSNENQDQPSPISVLEPLFEEDDNVKDVSCNINVEEHGPKPPADYIKPNLIDKSPRIESIARTLSWDDSLVETATSYALKPSLVSQGTEEQEEQEWLFFVRSLFSAAGLNGAVVQSESFFSRWHSPESLLDPSLRDKYVDLNDNETTVHEARRRQMRSTRKLVFDCVNEALVDIVGGNVSETSPRDTIRFGGVQDRVLDSGPPPALMDKVWARMKEWFSSEVRCFSGDGGDRNRLAVERMVRKEVVGMGWAERLEIDGVGKEIEEKLLEELLEEAAVQLTGKV
ncbi:hypothetical protein U1Q18_020427 [Sarracenia purpurea var. burkii]